MSLKIYGERSNEHIHQVVEEHGWHQAIRTQHQVSIEKPQCGTENNLPDYKGGIYPKNQVDEMHQSKTERCEQDGLFDRIFPEKQDQHHAAPRNLFEDGWK